MASTRSERPLLVLWPLLAFGLALGWGCGGSSHGDAPGGPLAGSASGGTAAGSASGGTAAHAAASGASSGGSASTAGGTSMTSTGGEQAAGGGGSSSGGTSSSGGAAPCTFLEPACPDPQAACDQPGTIRDCFFRQTCHSTPGRMVCCDSGWEVGDVCPGAGGAGGAGSDACGGCDASKLEICVYQAGGPGPGHFSCATQNPCGAAGACACIVDQGACEFQAGGSAGYCVCDNGLD